ncbi:uncharacterized protein LOC125077284 [Vanessa atalanta]|uniref:uncharacterized protein LOC125077284 n=1 Tax=Vanessa atalanta TaxID=42275 RepID=UPI001FCCE3B0|nr:uncharacterized protein LOC125077284 [Vanessa atalanta]
MYTEENSDRDDDCEDERLNESQNVIRKSLSTVGFRINPENQSARPLALRSTQSFTGTVEELRFCNNFQRLNVCNRVMTTPRLAAVCPCGCLMRPAATIPFRTRERNTLALHIVSPEVLNYHGYNFEPSHIAMFWKKDCRMFLWKGKTKKNLQDMNNK